jgi:hypothetical protein
MSPRGASRDLVARGFAGKRQQPASHERTMPLSALSQFNSPRCQTPAIDFAYPMR